MASTLRVIVNDRPLRTTLTGVGHYIAQLLSQLSALDGVCADPFFHTWLSRRDWRRRVAGPSLDPRSEDAARGVGGSRKPWWLRRPLQAVYGWLFRRAAGRYDVYLEPNHIPMRCRLPTVTMVHDLSVLEHPEWHPADRVRWYEREFAAGVRQTSHFLAASEFTKRRLVELAGVSAERVTVTYQAPRPAFYPRPAEEVRPLLERLNLPARFFLFVGTLEPRKNVPGLLEAFAALPTDVRRGHPLVIAGAWGWHREQLRQRLDARSLGDDVRLLGYLPDSALAALYTACTALVWPTWYEGFGLPPLEAMACGAPVIVSDIASLPEVVGSAGTLLHPEDTPAWTRAMLAATGRDPEEVCALRTACRSATTAFSWQRLAAQTLQVLEVVAAR